MKFKALVTAVALAAAGVAHADISTSVASNGLAEVFATVYNGTASITIDLGLDQNVLTSNLSSPLTFNLSNDANWATFISKAGTTGLLWSVQSVDVDANNGFTTARIGQEAKAGTTSGTLRSNAILNQNFQDLANNFVGAVNADGDATINASTVANVGTAAYWGPFDGAATAEGFSATSNVVNSAAVSIFQFQDNLATPSKASAQYAVSKSADTVSLSNASGAYVLAFNGAVTQPVPEPESYGLALVALAAIGFAARRRSV